MTRGVAGGQHEPTAPQQKRGESASRTRVLRFHRARERLALLMKTGQLSEQALRQVPDDVPIGLCYLDTDLRYRHINPWLAELNGRSVQQHVGRYLRDVIPRVATGVEAQLRQVIETNTPIIDGMVEAETPAQPGVRRTFLHNYLPVAGDDDTVIGVSCVVQDITAHRSDGKRVR